MTHIYQNPRESAFRFGQIFANVTFGGDLEDAKTADIKDWHFTLFHKEGKRFLEIDITKSMEELDNAMSCDGLAGVFRSLHCPKAKRELYPTL